MTAQSYSSKSDGRRAKRRAQRRARKLRVKLEKQKLFINNRPALRTLKPAVRKRLARERAPGLWILPPMNTKQGGPYAHASLLGLPAELRQTILLLSYDVNAMVVHTLQSTERGEGDSHNVATALRERITQLCQVSPVLRDDMQYVGRVWQQQIESSEVKIKEVKALIPLPQGLAHSPHGQSGAVMKGREKSLHKIRSAKCWYCNERHARTGTGCPRATENPQGWLEDTRAIGGWRSTKDSFTGTKIVFSD